MTVSLENPLPRKRGIQIGCALPGCKKTFPKGRGRARKYCTKGHQKLDNWQSSVTDFNAQNKPFKSIARGRVFGGLTPIEEAALRLWFPPQPKTPQPYSPRTVTRWWNGIPEDWTGYEGTLRLHLDMQPGLTKKVQEALGCCGEREWHVEVGAKSVTLVDPWDCEREVEIPRAVFDRIVSQHHRLKPNWAREVGDCRLPSQVNLVAPTRKEMET
jgi:hypothetical protein